MVRIVRELEKRNETSVCTFLCHASYSACDCEQNEKLKLGNSRVIRREFRGNSDSKKGIQIKCIKHVVCFAIILEAEAPPSSPFIILKGEILIFRDAGEAAGCTQPFVF